MTKYRVEIDGQTVWEGEGDDWTVIPEQFRARPEDTFEDEPHPSPHYLYESVGDPDTGEHGAADQLFGVQTAYTDELEQIIAHASPIPADVFSTIANGLAHPEDAEAVKAASAYHPDDVLAVKAAVAATSTLAARRAELTAKQTGRVASDASTSFIARASAPQEGN